MGKFRRIKTKIVATLGPASSKYETILNMARAGATVFRLNSSHGSPEDHKKRIDLIREAARELNMYLAVLVDLQGPKIRVGAITNPIQIKEGQILCLKHGADCSNSDVIPVDYAGIANDVKEGDKILLDDGKIGLKVLEVKNDIVKTEVLYGELLKPRKGINIPGTQASLPCVTDRDKEYIKFAVQNDADFLALSFVRDANDIIMAKDYMKALGADIPIIAKIEKPQAVENLKSIIKESYGVMVARGDLGIEMSPEQVPIAQKEIIKEASNQRKTCIVATQMLESMIEEPIPTRAEASDVANAILDGADAVMLSGETAAGKYPVQAVKMMNQISDSIETSRFCPEYLDLEVTDEYEITPQAIANAAAKMAHDLHAKAIFAFTHTGYTPRLLSKIRPQIPIVALSDQSKTCRKLNLSWNICPFFCDWDTTLDETMLKKIDSLILDKTEFKKDERIIIIGSIPQLITGRTNFIRVHRIGA
ncbi:MAG: pyruvate kinase [Candidatus Gastranaerophilaceae bacterium]